MKFIISCVLFVSASMAWSAGAVKDFNKELIQDVQKEIKKDDDSFKSRAATRAPASVEMKVAPIEEPSKIDKNVRQIGPNKW